jgi:Undecaprenyl-phosphate galactose phosphotransferase WbaP
MVMGGALACADFCAAAFSVWLGFRFWTLINPRIPPIGPVMLLVPLITVAVFTSSGLYPGLGLTAVTQMRRISNCLTLVYLFMTAAMFMTKNRVADSRGGFFLAWLLSLILIPSGKWIVARILMAWTRWGVPVVIVGTGNVAQAVIASLRQNEILGYRPVACIAEEPYTEASCQGVAVAGSLPDIEAVAVAYGANHAIVAIPSMAPERLVWLMRRWSKIFPRVLIVPNLGGLASLWVEPRDLGGVLALEIQHNLLNPRNRIVKRAADIVISALALTIGAPIIGIAALAIRWRSPGSPLYVQEREGKDGTTIRIVKLRSMFPDAETLLERHLEASEEALAEWNRFCKLKRDPRIIPGIGHFIRRTSIDELPQLWNVLKGEMSLVGPRPFPAYHNRRFDPDFRSLRTQVMPGLTGLWQVAERSNGDLSVQETLDAYYIRNWSLWLDIYIMFRTVRAVLMPSGSW